MKYIKTEKEQNEKKCTPKQKELLNLFNDLSDTVLTDETLESKSQEEENENKNENDKTLIPSKDEKEKENENEDENKSILLEYMENIDDKLFKEYGKGKNFGSFMNEFDRATNEEDKEKVVKEFS